MARVTGTHQSLSGPGKALRQTSLWMMLATLARPDSGSLQVKASGMDSFFLATKSLSPSSMPGSIAGAVDNEFRPGERRGFRGIGLPTRSRRPRDLGGAHPPAGAERQAEPTGK